MAFGSPTISSDPLASRFGEWRSAHHTALIPYVTAGYPTQVGTLPLLEALDRAGADIIELGVPFSDPVADGPTIQRSSQVALENGVNLAWTLDQLARFRRTSGTPIVIFTYLNPLLSYGVDRFISDAVSAGAQAVLVTDLPLNADAELESTLESSPLALIRLIAPTTAPERARELARRTQGFLYYVARLGVTGARAALRTELLDEIRVLRAESDVAIAVGFGISTADQARTVATAADGIVVGSALIDALDRGGIPAAEALLAGIRAGLR